MAKPLTVAFLMLTAIVMASTLGCNVEANTKVTPTPTDVPVKAKFALVEGPSYSKDIQPIFDDFCVSCHGPSRAENGLRLDSYERTMAGTKFGPVVVLKQPDISTLVTTIESPPSSQISMPKEAHRLSPNRIKNIRYWVEAGALNN